MNRHKHKYRCLAGLAAIAWLLAAGDFAQARDVKRPGSTVGGRSIGEWTADWWNWALAEPSGANPVADDTTGQFANLNQPGGQVFFLAGTFGTEETRTFDVPSGKYLLAPLANIVAWAPEDAPDEPGVRAVANDLADDIGELHFRLDGVPLAYPFEYREESPGFTLVAPPGNVFGLDGNRDPAVSDGYWAMVKPLSIGSHVLEYGGTYTTGPYAGFSVSVTANINVGPGLRANVVPEPCSGLLLALGGVAFSVRPRRRPSN